MCEEDLIQRMADKNQEINKLKTKLEIAIFGLERIGTTKSDKHSSMMALNQIIRVAGETLATIKDEV